MASKTTISKSTILELQRSLCSSLDPNMIIEISSDNTTIFISNITSETFVNLRLVSNNPSFGTYYFFMNLHVFIGDSLSPTKILGLDQIIESKIRSSDLNSFIDNKTTHTPFSNGFRNGLTINQLINRLSLLSLLTPDVPLDAKLRFTLVMDPKKKKSFWGKVGGGISGALLGGAIGGKRLYDTKVAAKERENFDNTYDSAFGWMEGGKKGGVDPQFTTNEDESMDDGGGEEA
jgi:hypothetical protein